MAQRLGFWRTLVSAKGQHWREALLSGGYTFVGLAPLWFTPILLAWSSRAVDLTTVAQHGEFALYSASVVAPVLYLLGRDRGPADLPGKGALQLLSVTLLVLSIAAYAPIATVVLGTQTATGFNADYYSWSTVVLFVFCFAVFIAATLVENARQFPPVQQMAEQAYGDLEREFRQLGEGR